MHHIILLFTSFFSDFFMQKKKLRCKKKEGDRFKIRITYEYMRTLLHLRLIPDDPSWHNYQKRPKNQWMTIATILPFSCPFLLFFLDNIHIFVHKAVQSISYQSRNVSIYYVTRNLSSFWSNFHKNACFSLIYGVSFTTSQK